MTTTAKRLIERSLVLIGAIAAGESASADSARDGLESLNDMIHGWAKEGADFGHQTLALGDTLQMHDSFIEGIRFNLSVRLAPEYGMPVPEWISKKAIDTFLAFQAHLLEFPDDLRLDRMLDPRYFSRRTGAYNIDNS